MGGVRWVDGGARLDIRLGYVGGGLSGLVMACEAVTCAGRVRWLLSLRMGECPDFWVQARDGFQGDRGIVLLTPGASPAWGARGYDCGPEPSLRTAPLSSSSAPSALPSDSLGRIYTPRAPQAAATPGSGEFSLAGAGAGGVLEVLACGRAGLKRLAVPAPRRPRGRPGGAYAVSCVGVMTLRARADFLVSDGLDADALRCLTPLRTVV